MFHTDTQQTLGPTIQNLVIMAPWVYVRLIYSIPQMHITVYVLILFYLDISQKNRYIIW